MVQHADARIAGPLGALFAAGTSLGLTDDQLVDRFLRDEPEPSSRAFETIVDRHGPMVWRVCRSTLKDDHDAGDAFQATFALLARRASAIRRPGSLAAWLHGTAARVSARLRVRIARRRLAEARHRERFRPAESYHADTRPVDTWPELHEEVARLPARYREVVVLCYLQGQTHDQAADALGCPVGTVRGRLSRARDRLRHRLIDRGLAPPAAMLAARPLPAPPPRLVALALKHAAGTAPAGLIRKLVEGVLTAVITNPWRTAALALAGVSALALGLRASSPGDDPTPAPAAPSAPPSAVRPTDEPTTRVYSVADLVSTDEAGQPDFEPITRLITSSVHPNTWQNRDFDGSPTDAPDLPGQLTPFVLNVSLIVRHDVEVHERLVDFLRLLRRLGEYQKTLQARGQLLDPTNPEPVLGAVPEAKDRHTAPTPSTESTTPPSTEPTTPPMGAEVTETRPTSPAPQLSIKVFGPEDTENDGADMYRIYVTNQGDLPAINVSVAAFFNAAHSPGSASITSSKPLIDHEKSVWRIYWKLPLIEPRRGFEILLPIQLEGDKDLGLSVAATAADPLRSDWRTPTVRAALNDWRGASPHANGTGSSSPQEPKLLIRTVGPRRVARNGDIAYRVVVRNIGPAAADNVRLSTWLNGDHTAYDPENSAKASRDPDTTRSLHWSIPTIPAGGSVQKSLIARLSGEGDLVIHSYADVGPSLDRRQPADSDEFTAEVIPAPTKEAALPAEKGRNNEPPPAAEAPAPPKLAVRISGPREASRDSGADYIVRIYNDGDVPAEDVSITADLTQGASIAQELRAIDPSASIVRDEQTGHQRISWKIPRLEVAERRQTVLHIQLESDLSSELTVQASARNDALGGFTTSAPDRFALRVPDAADVRVIGPSDGTLDVGGQKVIEFRIANLGKREAKNIRIEFDGSDLVKVIPRAQDGSEIEASRPERGALPTIESLGPGRGVVSHLRLEGLKPGVSQFLVNALWDDAAGGGEVGKVFEIRVGEPASPPSLAR